MQKVIMKWCSFIMIDNNYYVKQNDVFNVMDQVLLNKQIYI